jgi:hypothetical protein
VVGGYASPAEPVLQPDLVTEYADHSWSKVARSDASDVTVQVSPAIGQDPETATDWVVKLDSVRELKQVKLAFDAPSTGYEFRGCNASSCGLGGGFLGPTVETAWPSHAVYDAGDEVLYVVLRGSLEADANPSQDTLLHVPGGGQPGRVTLGVLRVPASEAGQRPVFKAIPVYSVAPTGGAYLEPDDPDVNDPGYSPTLVALLGSGEGSDDSDSDSISNDTDNCVFAANVDQADGGGLEVTGQPVPAFDGMGDECQCGDGGGDGSVGAADVAALQETLTQAPGDPAAELCSISRDAIPLADVEASRSYECNAKDALMLELAIQDAGAGVQEVCARNTASVPDNPQ